MILVLGHPRCGTRYMSELLKSFGFQVGHEQMDKDGISCWAWATDDPDAPWCPGQRSEYINLDADTLIHVVRHPIRAIQSIANTDFSPASVHYRERYTPMVPGLDALNNAALSFLGWNALIDALQPDVVTRVEDAPKTIGAFLSVPVVEERLPPTNVNTRQHMYTPKDHNQIVRDLDPLVVRMLHRFCELYGYALERPKVVSRAS